MGLNNLRDPADNRRATADEVLQPSSSSVHVDVSGLSHAGTVRSCNEDHFIVTRIGRYLETALTSLPPGEVPERFEEVGYAMIVADGMGGHAAGELASRMAISGLIKLALARPDWIFRLDNTVAMDATERSKRRFQDLNTLLIEHGRRDPDSHGMGTTLTAAPQHGTASAYRPRGRLARVPASRDPFASPDARPYLCSATR